MYVDNFLSQWILSMNIKLSRLALIAGFTNLGGVGAWRGMDRVEF